MMCCPRRTEWEQGITRQSSAAESSSWWESGRKVAEVAADLRISDQTIYTWRRQDRMDPWREIELAVHRRATELLKDRDLVAARLTRHRPEWPRRPRAILGGMADRGLRLFMTSEDVADGLSNLRDEGAVVVVKDPTVTPPARQLKDGEGIPLPAREVYFGFVGLSTGQAVDVVSNPGAHAWVRLQLPRHENDILYMAVLDIRTKWITHDNSAGIEVFNRVSKPFRRRLHRPTYVWSLLGGGSERVGDVAFTDRARAVFEAGTEWMQAGVRNVRYGPERPTSDQH